MGIQNFLDSFSWEVGVAAVVAFAILFSVIVILATRLFIDHKTLKAHHDVSGFVFANLGVLYSVLLGFTFVNVQQRFDRMKEYSQVEAGYLLELYHDAEMFSEKQEIRQAIINYAKDVIEHEWKLMSDASYLPKLNKNLEALWMVYYSVELKDKKQQIWFSESINKLNQLMNARLSRLLGIYDSLNPETWAVLLIVGIVIVGFVCAFGFESISMQILMGSTISIITALILFLIYSTDTVYSGAVQITPEAMSNVLKSFSD